MLRRIRKRERVSCGSGALVAVLAVWLVFFLGERASAGEISGRVGAYSAASTGRLLKTTTGGEGSEHLFVLDTTPADLHRVIESVRAPRTGSGCAHWAGPASRAGMLVPIPGPGWLLVGERGDARRGTNDFSIGNLQRKYPLIRFRRSGSPRVGEIAFILREADAEVERPCVERLRGVVVQWLNRADDPDAVAGPSKMVVRDVRFARAAVIGPGGESVPTGDIVVKLSFVEGFISMVWREMTAQRWGIAGGIVAGVLLTILAWIGGGTLRRLRSLKVLNRSHREESVDDAERQSEKDGDSDNSCPADGAGLCGHATVEAKCGGR